MSSHVDISNASPFDLTVAAAMFAELYAGITVADAAYVQKWKATTGMVRLRPYKDATEGALFESSNAAESAYATLSLRGSQLKFHIGSSGTSGMEIDASGNVLVDRLAQSSGGKVEITGNLVFQPSASAPTLGTNGDLSFQAVSNTSVKMFLRGTDGTTRSVTFTLA